MRKHGIDIVFSLSLFMIFVICSFLLILFQINGYHELQYDGDNIYTISSYIQTEVRQSDASEAIEVKQIQGKECLVLHHEEGVSYLYLNNQYLMELYQDENMDVNFNIGEKRFMLNDWNITMQDDMLRIMLIKDDEQIQVHLRLKSGGSII